MIGGIIDWFMGEIQALSDTFMEANISCFIVAGVLRMLEDSSCEQLPELCSLAASSDASLLRDILEEIERIAGHLVQRSWTNHDLLECMRHLKEENQVSFASTTLFWG
jgi:hypothetical protein